MTGPVAPPVPRALQPAVRARVPYDVRFAAPGVHRGLPGTTLTVVLPLDEPLAVRWPGREARTGWTSVAGLHAGVAEVVHTGSQRGVQLALSLEGARLLGVPPADLVGALTGFDELPVVPALAHLPEVLHGAVSWAERVRLLDAALLRALAAAPTWSARPDVEHAVARLERGAPVRVVADEVGLSRRRLGTLVREHCGLTPKAYQRVARFERSRRLLGAEGGRVTLADVAQRCGYADQSHLARDWVDLAGCAPSTWLREEFPFVQDGAGSAEAR